jgi:predicted alpha-1,2-mannosidase
MVNLSPDTRVGGHGWNTGYRYTDEHVHWFSHVHAWQLCGIPVMPTLGEFRGHEGSEAYRSRFTHDSESAEAGYHSVYLDDYAIRAELTATTRVGFHRYTFDRGGDAWIILDLGASIMLPMSDCQAERIGPDGISGFVENDATRRRPKKTRLFFDAVFDRDAEEARTWKDGGILPEAGSVSGARAGIALRFSVKRGGTLRLKVGISYCGVAQARLNRTTELPHWDFDRTRREAQGEWDEWLGRIEVEGGSDALKTKFYTDLFHALKGRRRVSDVNGKYMDMTGDVPVVRQIPLDPDSGRPLYDHYNSDAFWGAAWSLNLLWPMAWPEVTAGFCNTLVDMYRNGGLIPRGPSGGNYTFVMSSPTSTTFLVSAWMQNVRSFDIEAAFEGMLKNHGPEGLMAKAGYEHHTSVGGGAEYYLERGYVPLGIEADAFHVGAAGTQTLEYAYHDWALSQLAGLLGRDAERDELARRAGNYRNVFNPATKFMQPRDMSGEFLPDFDPMDSVGWEEGNGHHYRRHVPHDVAGLVELLGGRESFVRELDALFEAAEKTGFVAPHGKHGTAPLDYGNQPCMYVAHLFNYAGAPWLTQKWVRRIMQKAKSDTTPFGGFGGDEDQGQMGALNALMAIGLFNVSGGCNAEPFYEISSPVFDRVTVHLDPRHRPGKTFVIETVNNGPGERYIQSAELNGKTLERPWFPRSEFVGGGSLRIVLGEKPNRDWGSRPQDAPPSMGGPSS